MHTSRYAFFLLFGVISIVAGITALAATFETRGKTVEEVAREVAAGRGAPVVTTAALADAGPTGS
jgi:putative MFS transporter